MKTPEVRHLKLQDLAAVFLLALCGQGCIGSGGTAASTTSVGTSVTLPSGPGKIQISWNANAGEQTGFYVEASSDGVNFAQVETVPDGTTTATVSGLATSTTYYLRIRGYNQAGDSPYTQTLVAKIP